MSNSETVLPRQTVKQPFRVKQRDSSSTFHADGATTAPPRLHADGARMHVFYTSQHSVGHAVDTTLAAFTSSRS